MQSRPHARPRRLRHQRQVVSDHQRAPLAGAAADTATLPDNEKHLRRWRRRPRRCATSCACATSRTPRRTALRRDQVAAAHRRAGRRANAAGLGGDELRDARARLAERAGEARAAAPAAAASSSAAASWPMTAQPPSIPGGGDGGGVATPASAPAAATSNGGCDRRWRKGRRCRGRRARGRRARSSRGRRRRGPRARTSWQPARGRGGRRAALVGAAVVCSPFRHFDSARLELRGERRDDVRAAADARADRRERATVERRRAVAARAVAAGEPRRAPTSSRG